ncbi:MAG: ABC transporter substrate-binding protein [Candidatus Paceibacterota bacterium]
MFVQKEPIKIGHLASLSGDYDYYGEWEKEGIDLAVEGINKKGGINGQKLLAVREDDQADADKSVLALSKLIFTDKIQAVIGALSSEVLLADTPIAEKNKVVLMAPLAGTNKITAGDYTFRIYPSNTQQGETLVAAVAAAGYKNVAIIYINNEYGLDIAKAVRGAAGRSGIDIFIMEGYRAETIDFKEQLARIKEKNPEAIFLLSYPKDMRIILKQAHEQGVAAKFFAPDTFIDPGVIASPKKVTEGIVYIMPEEKFSDDFTKKFKKKYGRNPNVFNALNYDALNLLALAIERGGNDGAAIKEELLKIKDYQGSTGSITFDANGNAINRPLTLKTVKEGKAVLYPRTKS